MCVAHTLIIQQREVSGQTPYELALDEETRKHLTPPPVKVEPSDSTTTGQGETKTDAATGDEPDVPVLTPGSPSQATANPLATAASVSASSEENESSS